MREVNAMQVKKKKKEKRKKERRIKVPKCYVEVKNMRMYAMCHEK